MATSVPTITDGASPRPATRTAWLRRAIPTAIVFAGLVAIAYWGHLTDWKFVSKHSRQGSVVPSSPQISVEAGPGQPGPDRCAKHGLPICPWCNPEVAQLPNRPAGPPGDDDRYRRALAARDRLAGDPALLQLPRAVRFASAGDVDAAGIDIAPAWSGAVTEVTAGSSEVSFHPSRNARLTAKVPGSAWRVFSQTGDAVRAGDILALVDAADVGKAKAELQVALVQVRLKSQAVQDLSSAPVQGRQRQEAEAALKEAEIRLLAAEQALLNLGLPVRVADLRAMTPARVADYVQKLGIPDRLLVSEREAVPGNLLPVRSPFDGIVLKAGIVAGEPVDTSKVLFQVADPRVVRITIHVRPAEARWVKVGQSVRFRPDGGGSEGTGQVTSVGVAADETTRTIPVWADMPNPDAGLQLVEGSLKLLCGAAANIPNPDGGLRASTLGTGRVVLREEPDAILVPIAAVQSVAGVSVVFVRDKHFLDENGPKRFHVRAVVLGAREGNNSEIIAGLVPGEVVATKGSTFLADQYRSALAGSK